MEVSGKRTDTDDEEEIVACSDKLCEPCEVGNINTPAGGFCQECGEYMCNACFTQHLRLKSCRLHTLSDINSSLETFVERRSTTTKCKQHDGDPVKYYCRIHETVGCGDCMISNHMTCRPEFIKDLSDNYPENEEYKTLIRTIEKLMSARKTFEKEIQENKKGNKLILEKALGDINQFRFDINKYLDKVEKDIICQVENVMKENESLLTKLENDCTALSTKLDEITNMLNSELFKDVILLITTVECKPIVCESEKAFSNMKSKSMKKYEYVGDQQLRSLISSGQKIGTLVISSSPVSPQISDRAHDKSNSQVNVGNIRTEDVKGGYKKEEAGVRSDVGVGARVESNWIFDPISGKLGRLRMIGLGTFKGTVTDVHDDSWVTVKWVGGRSGRYRIGVAPGEVTLIQS